MITDLQRRLIEYWKLRSEQDSHTNTTARERLTNAFRSANAGNEEVVYWMQLVEEIDGQLEDGQLECQMLLEAFEENEDITGAYQFCKSRISRGKEKSSEWEFFKRLKEKPNRISFSPRDLINICKGALQRDHSNIYAAEVLVKASGSLKEVEARIAQLKSALDMLKLGFGESL